MKNIFLPFSKSIYAAFLCNCLSLFLPSLSGSSSLNTPHTHTLSLFPSHSLTQTYFLSLQPLFFIYKYFISLRLFLFQPNNTSYSVSVYRYFYLFSGSFFSKLCLFLSSSLSLFLSLCLSLYPSTYLCIYLSFLCLYLVIFDCFFFIIFIKCVHGS